MKRLILPLVETLIHSYKGPDFSRVKIIGVQHILETTHAMFQALYCLGVKQENIALLGKCYSTCRDVYNEMKEDGIQVSEGSFAYSSHSGFDEIFSKEVADFLSPHINDIAENSYDLVIVLDDGGKCISYLNENLKTYVSIIAIEQTSSGYEAIRQCNIPFPVINVARSPVKLMLESPMIAQAAAERMYNSLRDRNLKFEQALVIGAGAIGKAVQTRLSSDMKVTIYDQNLGLSDHKDELREILSKYRLIIGCTGKTSIPKELHGYLASGTTLASVSSSDREFDAVHLRKQIENNQICHCDLQIEDLLLINSGFPVNFDGDRENIDPELIQLTIALITAGVLQARVSVNPQPGIMPVDPKLEDKIETEFKALVSKGQL